MNLLVFSKFARKNLKTNKVLVVPFVLSSSFMFMLFYVMASLSVNNFVVRSHFALANIITFGNFLVAVFSVIFVLYSNNILDKQRAKEFALYSILGLEKKHIALVVLVEKIIMYLFSCVLSIVSGYVFGKLFFLVLAKGLGNRVDKMTTVYNFEPFVALVTVIFMGCVYLLIYLINVARISTITPIALLSYGKKNESEPKVKVILFIFGLLSLFAGYCIALTTKGVIASLFLFFLATILVIVGTYLLFTSMSIFVLKLLRKNKRFYHKPKNFLAISGMLYRMKSNAVGLATICIFSTSVILSLGTTSSIFFGLEDTIQRNFPRDYDVKVYIDFEKFDSDSIEKVKKDYVERVRSIDSNKDNVKEIYVNANVFFPAKINGNRIENLNRSQGGFSTYYLDILDINDYNEITNSNEKLQDDEIILNTESSDFSYTDTVNFIGRDYKARKGAKTETLNINVLTIVVPSYEDLRESVSYYRLDDNDLNYLSVKWDSVDKSKAYERMVESEFSNDRELVSVKKNQVSELYELYGGFLFLGSIIAIIFLAGTVLSTYYKRISEAYDDRDKYQIMQKLGLEDELIKKTTKSQIVWIFFLPLLVAFVHCVFASKILSELLIIFGINSYWVFAVNTGFVLIGFVFVYLIVFLVTSRLVYKLVR